VLIEDGEWTNVITEGLADRQVNSIAEGPDGSLWFATAGGVSRFDGEEWTTYTTLDGLADNDSTALAVDGAGSVWVGSGSGGYTGGGMSRFDGQAWTTYPLPAQTSFNNVAALAVDGDGIAWAVAYHPQQFSSQSALFRFDGQQWIAEGGAGPLNDDLVYAFAIGPDGRMWFGTDGSYDGKTLVLWAGSEWYSYLHDDGHGAVRSIALDSSGHGWYGTDSGLYEFWAEGTEVDAQRLEGQRKEVVQAIALEPLLPGTLGKEDATVSLTLDDKLAHFATQGSDRP
jgi:ligand-binding sensor domain-containing protein